MSGFKLFVQRIGLVGLANLLSNLGGFILLPILTKNINIDDFGLWVQINVTISLISIFILLGLSNSMVRYLAAEKDRHELQECFYTMFFSVLSIGLVVSFGFFLLSGTIATYIFNDNLLLTRILSLVILFESLNAILFAFYRALQRMKRYSIFIFINTYLNIFLVSFFVLSGYGIYGAVIGLFASRLLVFIIMFTYIASEIGINVPKFHNIREYLAFGLPLVPSGLSSWVINSSDRYMISFFLGIAYVGYYSPGYILGNTIIIFIDVLSCVLPAALVVQFDGLNRELVKTYLDKSLKYFLLIAIPSTFGLSILSKPLLLILSTSEIADRGYLVTPLVAISMLLFGISTILNNVLFLEKKTSISFKIWVLGSLTNVGLNLLLIPMMGILGAAIATMFSFALVLLATIYYSKTYINIGPNYIFIIKSLLSSLIMSSIIIRMPTGNLVALFEISIIGAAIYLAFLILIGGLKKDEIRSLRELINI